MHLMRINVLARSTLTCDLDGTLLLIETPGVGFQLPVAWLLHKLYRRY